MHKRHNNKGIIKVYKTVLMYPSYNKKQKKIYKFKKINKNDLKLKVL